MSQMFVLRRRLHCSLEKKKSIK